MTERKPSDPLHRHRAPTRRAVLRGAVAAAMAAPLSRRAAAEGGQVVYATWGGSWAEAMRKAWFEP
ncbi:MAG: hypothetical protein JO010_01695, partial [Alphaproteobacteria bacterium]|nr:hypothetical protein [Alphaproteobacteria bacterium]